MNLRYRWATLDDAPLLARFNQRLGQDEGNRYLLPMEQLIPRMRGWLETGEYRAVIFEIDEGPVAYALLRQDSDSLYIRHFYVDRPHRRAGLGRACMKVLMEEIIPRDQRVTLDVLATNPAGRAFWEALGFKEYLRRLEVLPEERE